MQPIPADFPMECPICRVPMTYVAKWHMWVCSVATCGLQVWPPLDPADREYRSAEEMFRAASRPPGGLITKSSRSSSGRKRKKRKKQREDEDPWRRE